MVIQRGPNTVMKYQKNLIWLILFSIFLSACDAAAVLATPTQDVTPCSPPDSNAYLVTPINQNIIDIYENGVTSVNDTNAYNTNRLKAFNELVNHVYSLSDSVDIQSGAKTIRITITHIDPELVHIIVLNHYLYKRYTDFSGKLNDQMPYHMGRIARRNEYVFFVTFMESAYTDNTASVIDFPLEQMELTNTNNTNISRTHDDHNLENSITLNNSIEYGFVYFPMAVIQNGVCEPVLDANYDTRIMLSIPSIVINDNDTGSHTWEYDYAPLIDMTNVPGTHQYKFSLGLFVDQFTPKVIKPPSMSLESPDFWVAMSRTIWLETTLDP